MPTQLPKVVLVITGFFVPTVATAGDDFRTPATAAARELSRQLFYLQNTISLIPGEPRGRGLFKQLDVVHGDLVYFQQQLKRNVSREELLLNFQKMDAKLEELLRDIKGFERWDDALRMAAQRARAAQHDLQFALLARIPGSAIAPDIVFRHTLDLMDKSENFARMVRYVFDERDALKGWNADLAALKGAITELHDMEKNKALLDQIRSQLATIDRAWENVVAKVRALPEAENLLLLSDAAQVDRVIFRLAELTGAKMIRTTPLVDPLAF